MSRHEADALLWDIVAALDAALGYVAETDADQLAENGMAQAAVEMKLVIVGEAVNRLSQRHPEVADGLEVDVRAVVGLRNVLVHGYHSVRTEQLHGIVTKEGRRLRDTAKRLLDAD
jgi:uncharacterized protein with HEPN domain